MGSFDRSSKWLLQHHGDSLLRLAGVTGIACWRPLQAEVVQPAQLPDGLIEARLEGDAGTLVFVTEIATYPEARLAEQLRRDALLVLLDRGELPKVIALVLCRRGKLRVSETQPMRSPLGLTELRLRCRIVELWEVLAEELLATRDPGLMPWVPLTRFDEPPPAIVGRCREVIDEAPVDERATLLAVTQILTSLRYNDPGVLSLLGGREMMRESPLVRDLMEEAKAGCKAEGKADSVAMVLRARFGSLPDELAAVLTNISDERILDGLLKHAADCADLSDFRARIPS